MISVVEDTGIMWTSCCCLTVFFIFTSHKAGASSISEQELGAKRESVNAGNMYDFFTNDAVAQKFFISISLQVMCIIHFLAFPTLFSSVLVPLYWLGCL